MIQCFNQWQFPTPKEPGTYELRFVRSNGRFSSAPREQIIARSEPFTITEPPQPLAAQYIELKRISAPGHPARDRGEEGGGSPTVLSTISNFLSPARVVHHLNPSSLLPILSPTSAPMSGSTTSVLFSVMVGELVHFPCPSRPVCTSGVSMGTRDVSIASRDVTYQP